LYTTFGEGGLDPSATFCWGSLLWPAEPEERSELGSGTCSTEGCEDIGEMALSCFGGLGGEGDTGVVIIPE
jgi:hypothetical protein